MATETPYDRGVTSTRVRPRVAGRVRPGLLAPVVVAIVLGILGMHGLDAPGVHLSHVTTPSAMMLAEATTSSAAVMPDHGPVAAGHGDVHSTARGGKGAAGHASGEIGDVGGMGGMMMLCAAMLVGAAAALLAFLVRRGRQRRVWAVLQRAGRAWRPEPRVVRAGTGPPSVWRFSVIRC